MLTVQTWNYLSDEWETQWLDVPRKASGEEIIKALNQATEVLPDDPDDSAVFVDEDQVGNVRVLKSELAEYWNEPWYVVCTSAGDPESILLKSKFGTEYQQTLDKYNNDMTGQREAQMPADDFSESRMTENRQVFEQKLLQAMDEDPETAASVLAHIILDDSQIDDMLDTMLDIEEDFATYK